MSDVVQAQLPAEAQKPQAERDAICMRESLLQPPDWRYQQAAAYVRDEAQGKHPSIPDDPVVQLTIRQLRADRDPDTRLLMSKAWPDVFTAIYLGTTQQEDQIAAEIEQHIIHGENTDYQASSVLCESYANMVSLYKQIFFDIRGITQIHSWINDFLFAPHRGSRESARLRSHLLAYYAGQKDGADAQVLGMSSTTATTLMKSMAQTERTKRMFDYVMKLANLPAAEYAMLMESQFKNMTDRDFQERMKTIEQEGSESLESMAAGIEVGVRAYSTDEVEAANAADDGQDSNNKYTQTILRKDKDNEPND